MLEKFFNKDELDILKLISTSASTSGGKAYLIGGGVRDILLGKKPLDIDVALVGNMYNFVTVLKQKTLYNIVKSQPELRTAKFSFKNGVIVDMATTRQEVYAEKKAIPLPLNFGCSLKEDILRRDFSINALALSLNNYDFEKIVDYTNGINDLKNKQLRILHDKSFEDDPTRIIRGFKFAKRFGFSLEEKTKQLQEQYLNNIDYSVYISPERIKKEMYDVFKNIDEKSYNEFFEQNIYKILSDKINDVSYSKIAGFLEEYPVDEKIKPFIYLASIFLNEENYDLFTKMNLSKDEFKIVQDIKFLDGEKYKTGDMAIFRQYSNRLRASLVLELILKDNDHVRTFLGKMSDIKIEITGDDLIIMGISPSKNFKVIFDKVLEEKINGNLPDKISELRFVRKLLMNGEV